MTQLLKLGTPSGLHFFVDVMGFTAFVLVMGRLGRYENNLMTWVTPTNGKLVDRAARYVQHLLSHAGGTDPSYEEVVRQLFAEMDRARPDESIVLRTCHSLRNGNGGFPAGWYRGF